MLRQLLQNLVYPSQFLWIHSEIYTLPLEKVRIPVKYYLQLPFMILFHLSARKKVIFSNSKQFLRLFKVCLEQHALNLIPAFVSEHEVNCIHSILTLGQRPVIDPTQDDPASVSLEQVSDKRVLNHVLHVERQYRVRRWHWVLDKGGLEIVQTRWMQIASIVFFLLAV